MTAVAVVGREVCWWLRGLGRVLWRRRGLWLVLVGISLLLTVFGVDVRPVWVGIGVYVLALGLWARFAPVSFERRIAGPARRRRRLRHVRDSWPSLADSCGLVVTDRSAGGQRTRAGLHRLRWDEQGQLSGHLSLVTGQTVADVEAATDRLRTAAGARSCRVVSNDARTGCWLVWAFDDRLAGVVPFVGPNPVAEMVPVDRSLIGIAEDGRPFELDMQVSTLVVGATGAGKSSIMWGQILAQAPNIRSGLVELHGADLKGGMELTIGAPLFTRLARTSAEAVAMLEDLVAQCEARAARLAGVTRKHVASLSDPMILAIIDELAVLIAYETDRELLKRADAALRRLLAIGRAVGFYVLAFVQDPRKETVAFRHMFPQKVALRLDEAAEVDMVLGEGVRRRGAEAHHISRATPGVGFAVGEDGSVIRFRAAHIVDQLMRMIATKFRARRQVPIIVTPPTPPRTPRAAQADDDAGSAGGRPRRRRRTDQDGEEAA